MPLGGKIMQDLKGNATLLEPLFELEAFNTLDYALKQGKTPVLATGVLDAQRCHLIYALQKCRQKKAVIVTQSELHAKHMYEDLRYFYKDSVKLYPSKDIIFYSADVHSKEINRERFKAIDSLLHDDEAVVVMSAAALLNKLTPKDIFRKFIFLD